MNVNNMPVVLLFFILHDMKSWLISYAHDPTLHAQTLEQIYEMDEKTVHVVLSYLSKSLLYKKTMFPSDPWILHLKTT